ncbi:small acid-soluble spore protein H [Litchfieldia alkalitelluris]|uniref:small acid-soluble spore protein H n=1 Tax=Litchfieldia alkalitelluris TaxID=304268 RepID=UPI000996DFF1|nr:small acid-soluble spore protein H [Litchfieldia alkalitelluris]
MNIQRAKEIATLPEMVNVTYNGTPIYIQHVDDDAETARIFPLEQPQNEKNVPITQLIEH